MMTTPSFLRKRFYEKDWVGVWYQLAKKEAGTNDLISFFKIDSGGSVILDKIDISHAITDGLGGFTQVLERQKIKLKQIPKAKTKKISGVFKKMKLLYRHRHIGQYVKTPWKEFHSDQKVFDRPSDIAFQVLSVEESQKLESRAQFFGGSVNALLIKSLSQIISENFFTDLCERSVWLFPVNMRHDHSLRPFSMNNSSAIAVSVKSQDSVVDVHDQIRQSLKSQKHWVVWWSLNMGVLTGESYMKKVSARRRERNFCMGTFSNLGEFETINPTPDFLWTFLPPGTPNFPMSFSLLKWNKKWVLGLKKHPCLGEGTLNPHEILTKLRGLWGFGKVAHGVFHFEVHGQI
jgi:hypothetical protein